MAAPRELCDGQDNTCDGLVDEGCDDDRDGHCDAQLTVVGTPAVCPASPPGPGDDCNDAHPLVFTGAPELCDDVANGCGTLVDVGCDDDDDGYCDAALEVVGSPASCPLSAPYAADDCDDDNGQVHPDAEELCDGVSNACDATPDVGCDDDGDGYCDAAKLVVGTQAACAQSPAGPGNDCDDTRSDVNPGRTEVCDNVSNDCNAVVDHGCDDDRDGHCDAAMTMVGVVLACPLSAAGTPEDCNDADATVYPRAVELCDGVANACGATADEGCDDDGDGYCDARMEAVGAVPVACPLNGPGAGADCNDADAAVHPDQAERCGGGDDNCNARVDEGCDDDGDGYCAAGVTVVSGSGACTQQNDCSDTDAQVNPGASEVCGNLKDDNCDGATDLGDATACPRLDVDIATNPVRLRRGQTVTLSATIAPNDTALALTRSWRVVSAFPTASCDVSDVGLGVPTNTPGGSQVVMTAPVTPGREGCTYATELVVGGYGRDTVLVQLTNAPPVVTVRDAAFDGTRWVLWAASNTVQQRNIILDIQDPDDASNTVTLGGACATGCSGTHTGGAYVATFAPSLPAGTYEVPVTVGNGVDAPFTTTLELRVVNCVWASSSGGGTGSSPVNTLGSLQAALNLAASSPGTAACVVGGGTFAQDVVVPASPNAPDLVGGFFTDGGRNAAARATLNVTHPEGLRFASGYTGRVVHLNVGRDANATFTGRVAAVTVRDASPALLSLTARVGFADTSVGVDVVDTAVAPDNVAPLVSALSLEMAGFSAATVTGVEVTSAPGLRAHPVLINPAINVGGPTADAFRGVHVRAGGAVTVRGGELMVGSYSGRGCAVDLDGTDVAPVTASILGTTRVGATGLSESVTLRLRHTENVLVKGNALLGNTGYGSGSRVAAVIADGDVDVDGTLVPGGSTGLRVEDNVTLMPGIHLDFSSCQAGTVAAGILLVGTQNAVIRGNGRPLGRNAGIFGAFGYGTWSPALRAAPPTAPGIWLLDTEDVEVTDNQVHAGTVYNACGSSAPMGSTTAPTVGLQDGLPPNPAFTTPLEARSGSVRTILSRNTISCGPRTNAFTFPDTPIPQCAALQVNGPRGVDAPRVLNNQVSGTRGAVTMAYWQQGGSGVVLAHNLLTTDMDVPTRLGVSAPAAGSVTKWPLRLDQMEPAGVTLLNNVVLNRAEPPWDAPGGRLIVRETVAVAGASSRVADMRGNMLLVEATEPSTQTYVLLEDGAAPRALVGSALHQLGATLGVAVAGSNGVANPQLLRFDEAFERAANRLAPGSPALNAALPLTDADLLTDAEGDPRPDVVFGLPDTGPDEFVAFGGSPAQRAVTFTVADANGPVRGATITLGPDTLTTDGNGRALALRTPGTYPYTVSAAGVATVTGSAVVDTLPVAVSVVLIRSFQLTLEVLSGVNSAPLAGAQVDVNNQTLTTGADGRVSVVLAAGLYDATFRAGAHVTVTRSVAAAADGVVTTWLNPVARTVTVTVVDGTQPLSGALVSPSPGVGYTTPDNGVVSFNLLASTTPATLRVSRTGYAAQDVVVPLNANVSTTVTLQPLPQDISFTVSRPGVLTYPVPGAVVTVDGTPLTADNQGHVRVQIPYGHTYTYSATLPCFSTATGTRTATGPWDHNLTIQPQDVSITARVQLADGSSVGPGVTVAARNLGTQEVVSSTTDAAGQVALMLGQERHHFVVTSANHYGAERYEDVACGSTGPTVVVAPKVAWPLTVQALDWTPMMQSPAGTPVPLVGAVVRLSDGSEATTNSNGTAVFMVFNGTEQVTLEAPGYRPTGGSVTVADGPQNITLTTQRPTAVLRVQVRDQGVPVPLAQVSASQGTFQSSGVNINAAYQVVSPLGATSYRVEADGYLPASGAWNVVGNATFTVSLTRRVYAVELHVMTGSQPLEGALVQMGPDMVTTGAGGTATFMRTRGSYDWTVSRNGYFSASGTAWPMQDGVMEVVLEPRRYEGSVLVTSGMAMVAGAEVTVDGVTLGLTALEGSVPAFMAVGSHRVEVKAPGYVDAAVDLMFTQANQVLPVQLLPRNYLVDVAVLESGTNTPLMGGVTLSVNGVPQPTTQGSAQVMLLRGRHTLTADAPDHDPVTIELVVLDQDTATELALPRTEHEVTVTVVGDAGPLRNAEVTIHTQPMNTDAQGRAVTRLPTGTYTLSASADLFLPGTGTVTVMAGPAQQTLTLQPRPTYAVQFAATDGTQALASVAVTVTDTGTAPSTQTVTTTAGGSVVANLRVGTYAYTARRAGFQTVSGTVTVDGAAQVVNLVMAPQASTITFQVRDGTAPVEGATVLLGNTTLTTNAAGVATAERVNGTYAFTVQQRFFNAFEGQVTVGGVPVTATAPLSITVDGLVTRAFERGDTPLVTSDALASTFGLGAADVVKAMARGGFSPAAVTRGYTARSPFNLEAARALYLAPMPPEDVVRGVAETVGSGQSTMNTVATALREEGAPALSVAAALRTALLGSAVEATRTLRTAGFPLNDVVAAVGSMVGQSDAALISTLRNASYTEAEVAMALVTLRGHSEVTALPLLCRTGCAADTVQGVIAAAGGSSVGAMVEAFRAAGLYARNMAETLAPQFPAVTLAQWLTELARVGVSIPERAQFLRVRNATQAQVAAAAVAALPADNALQLLRDFREDQAVQGVDVVALRNAGLADAVVVGALYAVAREQNVLRLAVAAGIPVRTALAELRLRQPALSADRTWSYLSSLGLPMLGEQGVVSTMLAAGFTPEESSLAVPRNLVADRDLCTMWMSAGYPLGRALDLVEARRRAPFVLSDLGAELLPLLRSLNVPMVDVATLLEKRLSLTRSQVAAALIRAADFEVTGRPLATAGYVTLAEMLALTPPVFPVGRFVSIRNAYRPTEEQMATAMVEAEQPLADIRQALWEAYGLRELHHVLPVLAQAGVPAVDLLAGLYPADADFGRFVGLGLGLGDLSRYMATVQRRTGGLDVVNALTRAGFSLASVCQALVQYFGRTPAEVTALMNTMFPAPRPLPPSAGASAQEAYALEVLRRNEALTAAAGSANAPTALPAAARVSGAAARRVMRAAMTATTPVQLVQAASVAAGAGYTQAEVLVAAYSLSRALGTSANATFFALAESQYGLAGTPGKLQALQTALQGAPPYFSLARLTEAGATPGEIVLAAVQTVGLSMVNAVNITHDLSARADPIGYAASVKGAWGGTVAADRYAVDARAVGLSATVTLTLLMERLRTGVLEGAGSLRRAGYSRTEVGSAAEAEDRGFPGAAAAAVAAIVFGETRLEEALRDVRVYATTGRDAVSAVRPYFPAATRGDMVTALLNAGFSAADAAAFIQTNPPTPGEDPAALIGPAFMEAGLALSLLKRAPTLATDAAAVQALYDAGYPLKDIFAAAGTRYGETTAPLEPTMVLVLHGLGVSADTLHDGLVARYRRNLDCATATSFASYDMRRAGLATLAQAARSLQICAVNDELRLYHLMNLTVSLSNLSVPAGTPAFTRWTLADALAAVRAVPGRPTRSLFRLAEMTLQTLDYTTFTTKYDALRGLIAGFSNQERLAAFADQPDFLNDLIGAHAPLVSYMPDVLAVGAFRARNVEVGVLVDQLARRGNQYIVAALITVLAGYNGQDVFEAILQRYRYQLIYDIGGLLFGRFNPSSYQLLSKLYTGLRVVILVANL